jgi:prepilin-type N-terminal cleavage/methylation domain-containing protein
MRGFSLLECLCSLAIVALLTASITQLVHRSSSILGATSDALDERLTMTKTGLVLSAALAALDRTHLAGVVSITNGSNPTTPHGSPHPASGLSGNTRPRTQSAIFSVIEVEPRYRGRVIRSSFSGNSISLETCGATEQPSSTMFRSHIAVGLSGACQLTGQIERRSATCFTLSGQATPGLISSHCPPHSLLEYMPVLRELSIFIDRTGELRLISHVGSRILENQPIARGLRSLDIALLEVGGHNSLYRIDVHATSTRSHRFIFAAGLTRDTLWNEILL